MKKTATLILCIIGALAILAAMLACVSRLIIPSNYEVALEEFGSPEGMAAISELYTRIEKDSHAQPLQVVKWHDSKFPKVRNIPKEFLPDRFAEDWGEDLIGESAAEWGCVLAYYDENDVLQGIEFYGSRCGCFVSRDATRCPSWYSSLHRIAQRPVYVSIRLCRG